MKQETIKAKYYIYRNLHTGNFSVKYKGKVIDHVDAAVLVNCEFRVSEKGRQRVLREGRKNVHAVIAATEYIKIEPIKDLEGTIYYNPYNTDTFMFEYESIHSARSVIICNNKVVLCA